MVEDLSSRPSVTACLPTFLSPIEPKKDLFVHTQRHTRTCHRWICCRHTYIQTYIHTNIHTSIHTKKDKGTHAPVADGFVARHSRRVIAGTLGVI